VKKYETHISDLPLQEKIKLHQATNQDQIEPKILKQWVENEEEYIGLEINGIQFCYRPDRNQVSACKNTHMVTSQAIIRHLILENAIV